MEQLKKIADPQGMISRIRSKMPPNCAVRKSPYCDFIIAMRMQGIAFLKIEEFLISQDKKLRISAPTIWRCFEHANKAGMTVELPLAEELKERWGGSIDLDLANEMAGQVLLQRQRIDKMIRQEQKVQESKPGQFNKLIRAEMETLNSLVSTLNKMLKSPVEAAEERAKADDIRKGVAPEFEALTPDAEAMMTDMILGGDLKVDSGNSDNKQAVN